ncbi:phage/plasmid replication protein, II/X family [Xanthomonas campestris]|nr:phage/plasmid replication protein, II/X family [Xanthomonas campestris]
MVVPCAHAEPITGGRVVSVKPTGEVDWQCTKRATVEGSFATGLQVRTCTHTADPCTHIEVSGNPVKFFQGHNLWGTDDLPALVMATVLHLVVGASPPEACSRAACGPKTAHCASHPLCSTRSRVWAQPTVTAVLPAVRPGAAWPRLRRVAGLNAPRALQTAFRDASRGLRAWLPPLGSGATERRQLGALLFEQDRRRGHVRG